MAESKLIPKRIQEIEAEDKLDKNTKIPVTYLKIAPFKQIISLKSVNLPNETACVTSDDKYIQIYKIKSYDLTQINGDEKQILIHYFANFLRFYQDAIKIVSMKFPTNTDKQQIFWEKKYRQAKNDIQRILASSQLKKLKVIEKDFKTQNHYLWIYGSTLEELKEKMRDIETYTPLFEKTLTQIEKERLIYQLNNQGNL